MERCKTCKHFETGEGRTYINLPGSGHCARYYQHYTLPDDMKPNEAWIENDEGWGNVVGPEFGCVLWELKTERTKDGTDNS